MIMIDMIIHITKCVNENFEKTEEEGQIYAADNTYTIQMSSL